MEIFNHLPEPCRAARHVHQQVVLVAVVNADVRVGVPDENGINSPVALFEIVEVAVHGEAACHWVVESAILDHHLRLDEARLSPLELGAVIFNAVVAHADQMFEAPMLEVGQPFAADRFARAGLSGLGAAVLAFVGIGRAGNLLALRRKFRVLGQHHPRRQRAERRQPHHNPFCHESPPESFNIAQS